MDKVGLIDSTLQCRALWLLSTLSVLFIVVRYAGMLKYFLKYYSYLVSCTILAGSSMLFVLLRPGNSGNIVIAKFIYRLTKINRWFGIHFTIEGHENMALGKTPFVLVANHQSSLDFLVILEIAPNRTAAVAKRELLFVPLFGAVLWLCGTIFVDRKSGPNSVNAMKNAVDTVKNQNTSVWIFPEGTRRQIDGLLPFKKGGFHLAIQAQVPVVPVVISNYRNILDRKNRIFNSGTIRVKILEPIATEGMNNEDAGKLASECREKMLHVFEKDIQDHANQYKMLIPIPDKKEP